MGWKENRRRKRTWYKHYATICDELVKLLNDNDPIAADALVKVFFDLYERRRLHKRRCLANSAYDSMALAIRDSGLGSRTIQAKVYPYGRPQVRGALLPRPAQQVPANELVDAGIFDSSTLTFTDSGMTLGASPSTPLTVNLKYLREGDVVYDKDVIAEPTYRLRDGRWEMSVNGGASWSAMTGGLPVPMPAPF